ncbi:Bromodomain-containing protein [Podospora australis]|uniref:Bromodomain-containing protein n=1 Tax=Podospora australis TaxID=1536484 RepID=A0AAN6X7D4_9PEZI|nr:Bromodomain-containing protein [Podospora australis]
MDSKRKAASSADADGNERAAKRLKALKAPTDYDLMKGESPESTSAYGLHFLETIRRTKDKSGRLVASYFENLLPREKNAEYYERIRMPISLKIIERKLNNQEFKNMSELESFFKRMVTNAKEFYPKTSEIFEDAERVRKALSNYMTKTNPAYKLITGYSCAATPYPEDGDVPVEPEEVESEHNYAEAEGDEEGEGDDDEAADEDEDDEDEDDEEDENPRKIILKRGSGKPKTSRSASSSSRRVDKSGRVRPDHDYEGVPYKGLSFQQAQEKIVEELIRRPDGTDPYYLDFINLPPRTYKDYFAVITSPLSLKGLQKLVKGIHGRKRSTGISDFKNWAAFEEKASLLWTNAHFYNEEGSVIHTLATELKRQFYEELEKAKAVVQEPPQPKIKLKVAPGQETPVLPTKKITIHVGGPKGSATGSPAPPTNQSADGATPQAAAINPQLEKARSMSISGASPSPSSVAPGAGPSPAMAPGLNGNVPRPFNLTNGTGPTPQGQPIFQPHPLQNGHPAPVAAPVPAPAPPPPPPVWDNIYRAPGRGLADALLSNVLIRTHPTIPLDRVDRRFRLEIPAHAQLAQQSFTVHIPANHHRLQLIPRLAPLEHQGRQYKLMIQVNGQMVGRATPLPIPDDPLPMNSMVFDLNLQMGSSIVVITAIAGLPKGQKLSNGSSVEVEKITIHAHLSRMY